MITFDEADGADRPLAAIDPLFEWLDQRGRARPRHGRLIADLSRTLREDIPDSLRSRYEPEDPYRRTT